MRRRPIFGILAIVLPFLSPSAAPQEPLQAVWQEQEIDFTYMGRTSFYSCDSIEHKVERVLREVGVREQDLKVDARGCWDFLRPERMIRMRIFAAVPATVTAGGGLSAQEKARRELVAKVRGESSRDLELTEQFPAQWQTVTFNRRSRYLEDGDCELLEQLENQVFPKLGIETTRDDTWCVPGQITMGQLNLEVRVLKAAPKPDDAP